MATTLVKNLGVSKIKPIQPVDLFTGDSIEITNSWQDISGVINVKGAKSVVLWLNYDRGDSADTQFRCLVGASDSDVTYEFVIETVGAAKSEIQEEVVELEDSDMKVVREFVLNGAINFLKFQVKDSADGTGQVDSAKLSVGIK